MEKRVVFAFIRIFSVIALASLIGRPPLVLGNTDAQAEGTSRSMGRAEEALVANDTDVQNKDPLVLTGKSPHEFSELSAEAKADLLCAIAESSYKILIQVPETGLRDSCDSIERIISARKWLENTDDVVARMLAVCLQYGVDSAVLNEMYREEKRRHGRPLRQAFKSGSFDNDLVNSLLRQNKINEQEYIDFALSLDTEIGKFCRRNNYKSGDFLTGKVFEEAWQQMRVSLSITKGNKKIAVLEHTDIRNTNLMGTIVWTGVKVESKKQLIKFLLPVTLNAIDDARDVRLLARVYMKYGGFADKVEMSTDIVFSKTLENRVLAELSNENIGRLTSHRRRSHPIIAVDISTVTGKMENRVDAGTENIGYQASLFLKFVPFVKNSEVFPEEFGEITKEWGLSGMWLNLSD